MENDLFGFATPPAEKASDEIERSAVEPDASPSPASFDLLSGSPVKVPQQTFDNLKLSSDGTALTTLAPSEGHDMTALPSPQRQESMSLLDFGGPSPSDIPSGEPYNGQASINLLDFGEPMINGGSAAPMPVSKDATSFATTAATDLFDAPPTTTSGLVSENNALATDPFESAPAAGATPSPTQVDFFQTMAAPTGSTTGPAMNSILKPPLTDPFSSDPYASSIPYPTSSTGTNMAGDAFADIGKGITRSAKPTDVIKRTTDADVSKQTSMPEITTKTEDLILKTEETSKTKNASEDATQKPDQSSQTPQDDQHVKSVDKEIEEDRSSSSEAGSTTAIPTHESNFVKGEQPDVSLPATIPTVESKESKKEPQENSPQDIAGPSTTIETDRKTSASSDPKRLSPEDNMDTERPSNDPDFDEKKFETIEPHMKESPVSEEGILAKDTEESEAGEQDGESAKDFEISEAETAVISGEQGGELGTNTENHEAETAPMAMEASNILPNHSTASNRKTAGQLSSGTIVALPPTPERVVLKSEGASGEKSQRRESQKGASTESASEVRTNEMVDKPEHGDISAGSSTPARPNSKLGSQIPTQSSPNPRTAPENPPRTPLPDRVKWLEKELHAAHTIIQQLQHKGQEEQASSEVIMVELQANLQAQLNERAEAENKARIAMAAQASLQDKIASLEKEAKTKVKHLEIDLAAASESNASMHKELENIREERDEQARKEASLTCQLNAAKKKEADKANTAEHYEEQLESLEKQLNQTRGDLERTTNERDQLREEVEKWKKYAEQRTKQLEKSVSREKKKNEERKVKMKEFVEVKTEEVRSAKSENLGLQTELDQSNITLKDLNQRYKQLHTQWVQAQTRNRELQRDITKMKKDSEKMSKVGGTLEAKLSRSAMATEDHKNKRLAAKNELMSVLGQLEVERDLNSRLRESIKVTFTPKALSQQQAMQDTLEDLEGALIRLATKLGKPLPPPEASVNEISTNSPGQQATEDTNLGTGEGMDMLGRPVSLSEASTQKVLQKLENETQRVSESIASFTSSVDRLHTLVDTPSTRSCVGALQSLLVSTAHPTEETTAMTGLRRGGNARYGKVSERQNLR